MKGRKILGIILLCFFIIFGSFTGAKADTILFPVIAIGLPNVTTVISVMNLPNNTSTHLKYIYRSKDNMTGTPATANHTGDCTTTTFTRPTFAADLVSFDASGIFNSGNAMFNDSNSYGGSFELGLSGTKRGYLLVTNSDAAGNRVDVSSNNAIFGEFGLLEIGFGAMWGGRAINDSAREDYDFTSAGTSNWIASLILKFVQFFPTNEWTTKFFVTPIGNSMDTANLQGRFALYHFPGGTTTPGIYTRGGTAQASNVKNDVTCTSAFNLTEMIDSTVLSAIENTGGYAAFAGFYDTTLDATQNVLVVYKLEYVLEDATYGGTNNNGFILSDNISTW